MKRFALKLVLFLLLGAILNVAVAWGCARWAPNMGGELYGFTGVPWDGFTFVDPMPRPSLDDWPERLVPVAEWSGPGLQFSMAEWERNNQRWRRSVSQVGLPAHSMQWALYDYVSDTRRMGLYVQYQSINTFESGFDLAHVDSELIPRRLPLRPIWPGFAINTTFYGAVLWLMFAFPFALRRRRRIRRGLCAKCAYDLRGGDHAACPECGKAVKQ